MEWVLIGVALYFILIAIVIAWVRSFTFADFLHELPSALLKAAGIMILIALGVAAIVFIIYGLSNL